MFPDSPTATKVLFPKVTPIRREEEGSGEVTLSQDEPLSVDLIIFPSSPTAINTPETEEEELSELLVELSEESSEVLSEESSEDEELEEELEELSSAHEEISTAMLTIKTNQEVRLFILLLI